MSIKEIYCNARSEYFRDYEGRTFSEGFLIANSEWDLQFNNYSEDYN